MAQLWSLSAHDLAQGVRSGQFSAHEVASSTLARITEVNPALHALVQIDPEWTLAQAREVDARGARGEHMPLAGVPVTVKDNLWVADQTITQGSLLFKDFKAPKDAWSVARLRAAGAVLVGISNCSEFACKGVTSNRVYGNTRSPWNLELTPGGSSGGAASAVASGMGALALATDAGGSTRRPAAHTGLVGMKPSTGRIPYGPGFEEPTFGLSVIGQIGRDVADVALMWSCLQGDAAHEASADPLPSEPSRWQSQEPPPTDWRIAYSPDLACGYALDADVQAALEATVCALRAQGYRIDEAAPNWPEAVRENSLIKLQHAGLACLHGPAYRQDPTLVDPDIAQQIEAGWRHSGTDIAAVLLLREQIQAACADFFKRYDILLCPTAPNVSWPATELGPERIGGLPAGPRGHAVFTPLFNHGEVPACSVPVGLARSLPVGLQVIGRRQADHQVLRMAAWIEKTAGPLPHPPLWSTQMH